MVCPFYFIAERRQVRSLSAECFGGNYKVYQQTHIPILGLTIGEADGCYRIVTLELENENG